MLPEPRLHFGNSRRVQRVLRRLCVRPAKPARAKKNAAKIPRHDAQHVHDPLALKHVQHRLPGRTLGLCVVAVALLAAF